MTRFIPGNLEKDRAVALFHLIAAYQPDNIVEVGSYLGRSSIFFASSQRQLGIPGRVIAIDPHTGDKQQRERLQNLEVPTLDLFKFFLRATGVENQVVPLVMTSTEAAGTWTDQAQLIFIDGWHSFDAVLEDGKSWVPHLSPRGIMVFDDIGHPEVCQAALALDREGTLQFYGRAFGLGFSGTDAETPKAVEELLAAYRPLTRKLGAAKHRLRKSL